MDSERIIFHIDMDAFFAAIEERENPQFRWKPIVVGADPKEGKGRGVVSTANYVARKYGIRSAVPISKAYRMCPRAVFLPVNGRLYREVSRRIMEMLHPYTPILERAGIDEVFLDMSHLGSYVKARVAAQNIKKRIRGSERITASIGIGPNKLIAKIASDYEKPDGLTIVPPENVRTFLDPMPVDRLLGVGPKAASRLRAIGARKVRDLFDVPRSRLVELFGVRGNEIFERARGIDNRKVEESRIIKSIGRDYTFAEDTDNVQMIYDTLDALAQEIYEEARKKHLAGKGVTAIVRYAGFETHTKAKTFSIPFRAGRELSRRAKQLALPLLISRRRKVRLVGIRISSLSDVPS